MLRKTGTIFIPGAEKASFEMTEEEEVAFREAIRRKSEEMRRAGCRWGIMKGDEVFWSPEDTKE